MINKNFLTCSLFCVLVLEDETHAEFWSELDSVMECMEPDRNSLPENFVATDMPLSLENEEDILRLAERMQLSKLAGPETLSLPDLRTVESGDLFGSNVKAENNKIDKKQQCKDPPLSAGCDSERQHFFSRQTTYKRMLSNLSSGSSLSPLMD